MNSVSNRHRTDNTPNRRAWFIQPNNETGRDLFLSNDSATVGWSEVATDISTSQTHEEIIDSTAATDSVHSRNPAVQLRKFAHEAQVGDLIILKEGLQYRTNDQWDGNATIHAIGVIDGNYTYGDLNDWYADSPPTASGSTSNHHRHVSWIIRFDELIHDPVVPEMPIDQWAFDEFERYPALKRQIESSRGLTSQFEELESYADKIARNQQETPPTVWIEKSYHSRDDRDVDGWGLGDALWCPQTRTDGGSSLYYDNATEVQQGDIILHLDQDKRAFTATSRAADSYEETTCLEDTEWDESGIREMQYNRGKRPAYRVPLTSHQTFSTALDVDDVLTEENGTILHDLRESNSVVYSKNLNLNQGAYLTEAPTEFVELISEASVNVLGSPIPLLGNEISGSDSDNNSSKTTDENDPVTGESTEFEHPHHPVVAQIKESDTTMYGLTARADYWAQTLRYRACGFSDDEKSDWDRIDRGDVLVFQAEAGSSRSSSSQSRSFVFGVAIAGRQFQTDDEWGHESAGEAQRQHRIAFDRLFLTSGAAAATDLPETPGDQPVNAVVDQLRDGSVSIATVNDICREASGAEWPSRGFVSQIIDKFGHAQPEAVSDLLAGETSEVTTVATRVDFTGTIGRDAFSDIVFPEMCEGPTGKELADQITAAVRAGDHVIFTGPPGTGKTEIARLVTQYLAENYPHLYTGSQVTTATADWSTFDTVGGYMPTETTEDDSAGDLAFTSGIVLNRLKNTQTGMQANEPIVVDELNRADIDKGFGQLFTLLSGQPVQLPYTKNGNEVELLTTAHADGSPASHQYLVPDSWRMFATMNSYDKTSLYEMSYAFMRRFAFIRIPAPTLPQGSDEDALQALDEGMEEYVDAWDGLDPTPDELRAIGLVWKHTNQAVEQRSIGPAIVRDMLGYMTTHSGASRDTLSTRVTNAVVSYIFPQLEGVPERRDIVRNIAEINSHDEAELIDPDLLETAASDMLQISLRTDS